MINQLWSCTYEASDHNVTSDPRIIVTPIRSFGVVRQFLCNCNYGREIHWFTCYCLDPSGTYKIKMGYGVFDCRRVFNWPEFLRKSQNKQGSNENAVKKIDDMELHDSPLYCAEERKGNRAEPRGAKSNTLTLGIADKENFTFPAITSAVICAL
jgi:hypothetical protein